MNDVLKLNWITRHLSIFAQIQTGSETEISFVMKTPSPEVANHLVELHNYDLIQQNVLARSAKARKRRHG